MVFLLSLPHFLLLSSFPSSQSQDKIYLSHLHPQGLSEHPSLLFRQALMKTTFMTGLGVLAGTTSISGSKWMPGA